MMRRTIQIFFIAAGVCCAQPQTVLVYPTVASVSVPQGTDATYSFNVGTTQSLDNTLAYPLSGTATFNVVLTSLTSADPASFDVTPSTGSACLLNSPAGTSFSLSSCAASGLYTVTVHTAGLSVGTHGFELSAYASGPDGFGGARSYGRGTGRAVVVVTAATPDFSLSLDATSKTGPQGGTIAFTFTQTALGGFAGTTTYAVSGNTLAGDGIANYEITGSGSGTLTFYVDGTAPGTNSFTLTGVSGGISHAVTGTTVVTTPPSPTIYVTAPPGFISETAGTSTTVTLTAYPLAGYTGPVTFGTVGTLDAGISVSFSPATATISGSGAVTTTATVTSAASGTAGEHLIQFAGTITGGAVVQTDMPVRLVVN